jgi:hypothetical protein
MKRDSSFSKFNIPKLDADALFIYNRKERIDFHGWPVWPNYAYFKLRGDLRQIYIYSENDICSDVLEAVKIGGKFDGLLKCAYGLVRVWKGSILGASNFATTVYRAENMSDALNPKTSEWQRRFIFGDEASWNSKIRGVYPLNILTTSVKNGHGKLIEVVAKNPKFGDIFIYDDCAYWFANIEIRGEIENEIRDYIVED